MAFDTPNGTRGTRQPPTGGPIFRWISGWIVNRVRRTGRAPGLGFDALVLTTIGRRSGVKRLTPLGWFPGSGSSWLIVASAGGSSKNPAWYYNLAAHPDSVQIDVGGQKVQVAAEQLHGQERDEAWQQIATTSPRFAKYQQQTDRQLPVIRLVRRPG